MGPRLAAMLRRPQTMHVKIETSVSLFDDAELQAILEKALKVLEATPFQVQGTDEVFDLLRSYGCSVDGPCVSLRFTSRIHRGARRRHLRRRRVPRFVSVGHLYWKCISVDREPECRYPGHNLASLRLPAA